MGSVVQKHTKSLSLYIPVTTFRQSTLKLNWDHLFCIKKEIAWYCEIILAGHFCIVSTERPLQMVPIRPVILGLCCLTWIKTGTFYHSNCI